VPGSDVLDEVPIDRHALDLSPPGWCFRVIMLLWCGIEKKDHNKKKWEVLRNI
jgi:hypothetical protein